MPIKNVDVRTLKQWVNQNEVVIIDVREPAEYEAENIPGSILIPLATVSKAKLPMSNGKKVVIHCRSGKRSQNACEKLLAEDPSLTLYNLEGGITAWAEVGEAVKGSQGFFLPLDQQVQLTIGAGVLVGSLLGFFSSPWWFLLSGFFGAGLSFAGLTGTCYLAQIMAKMPWNRGSDLSKNSCGIK